MSKNLKSLDNKNVSELCSHMVAELHKLEQQLNNNEDYASTLQDCKQIASKLDAAHKLEYSKISTRLSNEIYGDILRLNPNVNTEVQETGIDSVKTIIFTEMGFPAHERDELEQC